MYSHSATLYPMLAVGAFMGMFWTGIVVGHELGVGCITLPILGLLSGCIASVGVCELQRRDTSAPAARVGRQARKARRSTTTGTAAGSREGAARSGLGDATLATALPQAPPGRP